MNIKSILGFATVAIALSLTLPVQSANRKDLQTLLDTGNCPRCDLRDANLRGANLQRANLRDANLRGANLRDANLRGANLSNANLQDADLRDANLTRSNLRNSSLRNANLRNANLESVDVRGANFDGSDLKGANLKNTDLADSNYRNNDRRNDNSEKIALEFVSRTNDDIRIEIEADGNTEKIKLGGNNNKYRIYLSPQLYRLRFFNGSSRNSWKSGKLDLGRNRSDRMRIYVNIKDRSIQLENDEKAWNSD
jgi:Pentapeptide repeats (8 copies)